MGSAQIFYEYERVNTDSTLKQLASVVFILVFDGFDCTTKKRNSLNETLTIINNNVINVIETN